MKVRRIFTFILVSVLFYATSLFCHKQTSGFQVTKIVSHLPTLARWEMPPLEIQQKELLIRLFSQPFYYLDKGGQSYAFLSQDGKTVLKLFKMHNIRQYPLAYRMSLPPGLDQLRFKLLYQQKEKLSRLFNSCTLSYTQLKEETGLIYLNLNPDPELKEIYMTIVDKLGITHHLSLKEIPFALQKRVDRALVILKKCFKNGELPQAKKIIEEMISCLKQRYEKRIIDIDPAFKRNMGLSETRAIFMDIGAFFPAEKPLSQQTLFDETRRLHRWLKKQSPEVAAYMDSLITDQK